MAGRPRQFDIDDAVNVATRLFIQKGYEGATFAQLTEAMGISPPSFYAAFGSKEMLFKRVFDRYAEGIRAVRNEAVKQPTARDVVAYLLTHLTEASTRDPLVKGCLLVRGAPVGSSNAMQLREDMKNEGEAIIAALTKRFLVALKTGDRTLPGEPHAIARLTNMVLTGIATQAAGGVPTCEIEAAVQGFVDLFEK
ncbi:MAG: TetR/AcrR family transcriptional regulator [Ralstonia sp.]|uniref:TetR/AcrR family transcriptional regulator n=1 Tax=Ralstonia sp. TaxID=54061 RepID=UPI003F7FB449